MEISLFWWPKQGIGGFSCAEYHTVKQAIDLIIFAVLSWLICQQSVDFLKSICQSVSCLISACNIQPGIWLRAVCCQHLVLQFKLLWFQYHKSQFPFLVWGMSCPPKEVPETEKIIHRENPYRRAVQRCQESQVHVWGTIHFQTCFVLLLHRGERDVSPNHSPFWTTLILAARGPQVLYSSGRRDYSSWWCWRIAESQTFGLVTMDPKAAVCPSSIKHVNRCLEGW